MNFSKLSFFALCLLIIVGLSSCEKESIDSLTGVEKSESGAEQAANATGDDDETEGGDSELDFDLEDCFTVDFPVSIQYADGTVTAYNSEDEIEQAIEDWIEANPDADEAAEPQIVFPVNVTNQDGVQVTVNSEEEIEQLLVDCYGEDWEEGDSEDEEGDSEDGDSDHGDCDDLDIEDLCFEFVFPITLVAEDGSSIELQSLADAEAVEETEGEDLDYEISFPISVVKEDGTTAAVNNEDELEELIESCFE